MNTLRDFGEGLSLYRLWLHQGYADVIGRYRRTLLGPLWHTLSMAIFIIVTGIVWSAVLKVDLPKYMLYLSSGLVVWSLISGAVLEGCSVLIAAQTQALSTRIPYPMLSMSLMWRLLLVFLHQLPLCAFAMIYAGTMPTVETLWLIPAVLIALVSGMWLSLLAGLVTLRFRDSSVIIASLMNIAMFATPVFWSRDLLGPDIAFLADWNPLFHLVEIMRRPLLGEVASELSWIVSLGWMGGGLLVTMMIYALVRNRIAYWY